MSILPYVRSYVKKYVHVNIALLRMFSGDIALQSVVTTLAYVPALYNV